MKKPMFIRISNALSIREKMFTDPKLLMEYYKKVKEEKDVFIHIMFYNMIEEPKKHENCCKLLQKENAYV